MCVLLIPKFFLFSSKNLLDKNVGELSDLALDGHVDETRTVLTVLDDETSQQRFINFRLQLDVLRSSHLLQLLRNHELLLVFELHSGGHRGDLRVRSVAEQEFELGDDGLDLVLAALVHQQVQEVGGKVVEASLLADLLQNFLLLLRDNRRVGQETLHGGVRLHVRVERFHVGVHLLERARALARVDQRGGVACGHRVTLRRANQHRSSSVSSSSHTAPFARSNDSPPRARRSRRFKPPPPPRVG